EDFGWPPAASRIRPWAGCRSCALFTDLVKSVEWYDRAEAGHGKAGATLGRMDALGQQIEGDQDRARVFFRLAADGRRGRAEPGRRGVTHPSSPLPNRRR